jgi:hypothetical protein
VQVTLRLGGYGVTVVVVAIVSVGSVVNSVDGSVSGVVVVVTGWVETVVAVVRGCVAVCVSLVDAAVRGGAEGVL